MAVSRNIGTDGKLEDIQADIRKVAEHPLRQGEDDMLRIVGIKTFLDGGMLTGSAYMREPWGVSEIYAIQDPQYRGVLFIPREKLLPIVETTRRGRPAVHGPLASATARCTRCSTSTKRSTARTPIREPARASRTRTS